MENQFDKNLKQMLGEMDDTETPKEDLEALKENMAPVVYAEKTTALVETDFNNVDAKEDYEHARANLYGLTGKANAAIELMLKFAQNYENPKMLDGVDSMIDSSAKLSRDLLSLQKNINTGSTPPNEKGKGKTTPTTVTQNNNYYGSGEQKEMKDVNDIVDNLPDADEKKTTKKSK